MLKKRRITFLVIVVHFFVLFFLSFLERSKNLFKKIPKEIVVNTIKLEKPNKLEKPKILYSKSVKVKKIPKVKKRKILEKPKKRKIIQKPKKIKKIVSKRSESKKKFSLKLIKEIEKGIEKFELSAAPKLKNSPLKIPKSFSLDIEKENNIKNDKRESFQKVLIEHLKKNLHLPEYGEVRLKFTLLSDGSFKDIEVISSKSKKNEEYLKNRLPTLSFPWFNQYLKGTRNLKVSVTFLNDE